MIGMIAEEEDQIDLAPESDEEAIWLQTNPLHQEAQEAQEVKALLKDLIQFKTSLMQSQVLPRRNRTRIKVESASNSEMLE